MKEMYISSRGVGELKILDEVPKILKNLILNIIRIISQNTNRIWNQPTNFTWVLSCSIVMYITTKTYLYFCIVATAPQIP